MTTNRFRFTGEPVQAIVEFAQLTPASVMEAFPYCVTRLVATGTSGRRRRQPPGRGQVDCPVNKRRASIDRRVVTANPGKNVNQSNQTGRGNGLVGIGQIGLGAMAKARAQALLERSDIRLVAGCARSESSLEPYRKLTGARGTHDWCEVVGDAEVDAICVGTPTNTHIGYALAAIEAGKHVLVECPAVAELAHIDEMADAARRRDVVLYIGSNYRFDRVAQAVAFACANVGQVRLAQGDSSWRPDPASWFWDEAASGGVFTCVHLYQMAMFHCLGQPLWIEATFAGERSWGVAKVKYKNGAIGIATGGFHNYGSNQFVVVGSEGVLRQEADGRFVLQRGSSIDPVVIDNANPTAEDNACFLRCIRGEEDWQTHLAREYAILGLAIAAQRSAETDKRVVL